MENKGVMATRTVPKEVIARNFSKCAYIYDRYANIQMKAAGELAGVLPEDGIKDILEIGCGTGNYTHMLRKKFKPSRIKAVDISEEMIKVAAQKLRPSEIEFIIDDAEDMALGNKFDLITSNAAFQWFRDLNQAILKYRDALVEGGTLAFSAFGPRTFWELREAAGRPPNGFLNQEAIEKILNRYLGKVNVREFTIKEAHTSLAELLKKIKCTGARGDGSSAFSLKKTEERYREKFGRIEATYEVYICSGHRH